VPEITDQTVKKIARLANLKVSEEETARFAEQLEHILEHISTLNQLNTAGVALTAHALPMHNIWRDDQVLPCLERSQALAAAPDVQDDSFRVPRIIE
jgi:aspartyl-tRNA(Asn)/glutamyl-tRNA(Gln) amidotransferase subunit C